MTERSDIVFQESDDIKRAIIYDIAAILSVLVEELNNLFFSEKPLQ